MLFAARERERRIHRPAGAGARGAARCGRPVAVGLGDSRADGRADRGPVARRDAGKPVGVVGTAAGTLAGPAGGWLRIASGAPAEGSASRKASAAAGIPATGHAAARAGGSGRANRRSGPLLARRRRLAIAGPAARAGGVGPPHRSRQQGSVSPSAGALCGLPVRIAAGQARCTGRWPRRPTGRSTRTGARGIWPRRQPALTRTSLRSWSERPAARSRGAGLAAAAAFLERAAALTPEPSRRAQRALAAAQTKYEAGALDDALTLLATADAGAVDDAQRAQVDLLRAQIAFAARRGSDAPPLLLKAARKLEAVDAGLARATYLEALSAALFAGRLARGGGPDGNEPRPRWQVPRRRSRRVRPISSSRGWRFASPRDTRRERQS